MSKYDVYPTPGGESFLLDVQTDLLSGLNTRVVVPLLPFRLAPSPAARLNPSFEINGEPTIMVTQFLAAVPISVLKAPVASLEAEFERITIAIDMLMQGF
jgi:toxin CcdB